jgi:hypothetical protein
VRREEAMIRRVVSRASAHSITTRCLLCYANIVIKGSENLQVRIQEERLGKQVITYFLFIHLFIRSRVTKEAGIKTVYIPTFLI